METTLEKFARKTCYDYFQTYDVILIGSILIRILCSNYMLYNKKTYKIHNKKSHKNNVIFAMNYHKLITCNKCTT
jgi:hypothetical protein